MPSMIPTGRGGATAKCRAATDPERGSNLTRDQSTSLGSNERLSYSHCRRSFRVCPFPRQHAAGTSNVAEARLVELCVRNMGVSVCLLYSVQLGG